MGALHQDFNHMDLSKRLKTWLEYSSHLKCLFWNSGCNSKQASPKDYKPSMMYCCQRVLAQKERSILMRVSRICLTDKICPFDHMDLTFVCMYFLTDALWIYIYSPMLTPVRQSGRPTVRGSQWLDLWWSLTHKRDEVHETDNLHMRALCKYLSYSVSLSLSLSLSLSFRRHFGASSLLI
jgi:hypothetical protein